MDTAPHGFEPRAPVDCHAQTLISSVRHEAEKSALATKHAYEAMGAGVFVVHRVDPCTLVFFGVLVCVAGQVHKLARVTGFSVYWRVNDKER